MTKAYQDCEILKTSRLGLIETGRDLEKDVRLYKESHWSVECIIDSPSPAFIEVAENYSYIVLFILQCIQLCCQFIIETLWKNNLKVCCSKLADQIIMCLEKRWSASAIRGYRAQAWPFISFVLHGKQFALRWEDKNSNQEFQTQTRKKIIFIQEPRFGSWIVRIIYLDKFAK